MRRIVMVETHYIYDDEDTPESVAYLDMKAALAKQYMEAQSGAMYRNCYYNISFKGARQ